MSVPALCGSRQRLVLARSMWSIIGRFSFQPCCWRTGLIIHGCYIVTLIKILGKLLNCLLFNYVAMITTYFVLCESQNVNLHPPVSQKIMIVCISLSRLSAERVFSRPRLLAAAAGAPPRRSPSPIAGSPGFNPHMLPLVARAQIPRDLGDGFSC